MSCLSISTLFLITAIFFGHSIASSSTLFSFPNGKDPNFESQIGFFGGSKLVNGGGSGSSLQLPSSGRVIYKKPIKLIEEGKPKKLVSFSTNFSFSLSQGCLGFVLVPSGSDFGVSKFESFGVVRVKFSALSDGLVKIHVGIDVVGLVSAKVRNTSTVDLTMKNGNNRTFSWVDYEASSKRLEVRISQTGGAKPIDPLFWYPIDLSKMWRNQEALVGFYSNGSSSIHSWGFERRRVPNWIHSEPLDPNKVDGVGAHSNPMKVDEKRGDRCVTKILASMIFGVACGALTAFIGLYLWTVFGDKRPVVPEETVEFEYKKVKVVVDNKPIQDGSSKQLGV